MSVLAPEERILLRDALPAFAVLTACVVAWGFVQLVDGFVRALFGTVTGAIGWIPYAGRVLRQPVHKIEQKITHALGRAESGLDKRIGASFHKLAYIVKRLPGELAQTAAAVLVTAAALGMFLSRKLFHLLLHKALAPLWGYAKHHSVLLRLLDRAYRAVHHSATHAERHATVAEARAATLERSRARSRVAARTRANSRSISRLWRWVRHRRTALTTGAFIGALAWGLGRLGVSFIRCSNVRKVGRAICRAPSPLIDALIAAMLAELALANLRTLAEYAQDAQEEVTHEIGRLVGLELPRGRFTIE